MKSTLTAVVGLVIGSSTVSPLSAQSGVRLWHDCVTAEITDRLRSREPVHLSADRISLTGDTLRLSGRASISFNGTRVTAEEIVIEQASKQVVLTTVRRIVIGGGSRCAPPASFFPKIEYR